MTNRVAVVIDYQNMHNSAWRTFMPDRPMHEALFDPFKFACQIVSVKNRSSGGDVHEFEVSRVEVFRGLPDPRRDGTGNSRNLRQAASWKAGHQGVVEVTHRPLKYYKDGKVSEKGIDVLCALMLVKLARSHMYDTVILASRDTDLAPALEYAYDEQVARVEAVKWFDPDVKDSRGIIRTSHRIDTTDLWEAEFLACRDTEDYR